MIGDYLTEINVTSPTGLQQINRFDGVSLEAQIWDRIEARYGVRAATRAAAAARRKRVIRRTFRSSRLPLPAGPALAQFELRDT